MGKLLRSLHAENMRLYAGRGAVLALAAVFVIALVLSLTLASGGEESLLPSAVTDRINEPSVNAPQEYTVEETVKEEIQEVISSGDISESDISASDAAPEQDGTEVVLKTYTYDNWRDAYKARYAELSALNNEYNDMAEASSGSERGYYTVLKQECVREALIINKCLERDEPAGHSRTWNVIYITLWLMLLPVGVFASGVMSSKTAGELKTGVMNTLYTMPATRLKQYFAKYLSASLFALLLCASSWAGAVFGSMIGCGGIIYEGSCMRVLGENVSAVSFFSYSVELGLCIFASALILTAFSAAVSTLTRSQGAATALTAILCLGAMVLGRSAGASGNIITGLSIFAVLDISAPLRGIPNFASAGHIVSWLCAALYWLVFVTGGYIGTRRDIK